VTNVSLRGFKDLLPPRRAHLRKLGIYRHLNADVIDAVLRAALLSREVNGRIGQLPFAVGALYRGCPTASNIAW
jgi:hypothetical protein